MKRIVGMALALALAAAIAPQGAPLAEAAGKKKAKSSGSGAGDAPYVHTGRFGLRTYDVSDPHRGGGRKKKGKKAKGGQRKTGLGSWSKVQGLDVTWDTPPATGAPKGGRGLKSK